MRATTPSTRFDNAIAIARAQRACFTPTNRELTELLRPTYGRNLAGLHASELTVARLVFAQAALMAGAALAADSETFFGAEQLWREMQDRIGVHERALARRFLELLARDAYYSESERRIIRALADSITDCDERQASRCAPAPQRADVARPPFARSPIELSAGVVESLRAQRESFAPSNRELTLFFQAEFGRGRSAFRSDELQTARLVFGQVLLMVGAALAADAETYLGAEQLWADMQDGIGARERAMARRFLDVLSRDAHYTETERRLVAALAATLH